MSAFCAGATGGALADLGRGFERWGPLSFAVDAVAPSLRMFDVAVTKLLPFLNPVVEPGPGAGRELQLIDPASDRLRFYEPGGAPG